MAVVVFSYYWEQCTNMKILPCFRYILDNGEIVKNRQIIDIGCGCGAGAIAAAKMSAKSVLANDIDPCKYFEVNNTRVLLYLHVKF